MSDSLREQLLKAGFAPSPQPKPQSRQPPRSKSAPRPAPGQRKQGRAGPGRGGQGGEMDLARAYALRERDEREARERERRAAEQRARERKERRQKLSQLLAGKALNDKDADIPRHFPHGNRIRRIYVTAAQLPQINGGELAVVQLGGRYLLVTREAGLAAQAVDADALVLLCEPHATGEDDVPADLMW